MRKRITKGYVPQKMQQAPMVFNFTAKIVAKNGVRRKQKGIKMDFTKFIQIPTSQDLHLVN